ncbi:MAG: PIN domain-containing protein [Candidatus Nanopelagicales bacterium]
MPDVVLIETVYVLERVMLLSRATVVESVELALRLAQVDCDRPIWRTALDDYLAHPKLSIADTYLHARASATGRTPLLTFDRKLATQLPTAELVSRAPHPRPDLGRRP